MRNAFVSRTMSMRKASTAQLYHAKMDILVVEVRWINSHILLSQVATARTAATTKDICCFLKS